MTLPAGYTITSVKMYNRADCCGDRILNVKVKVDSYYCGKVSSSGSTIDVACAAAPTTTASSVLRIYKEDGGSSAKFFHATRNYIYSCHTHFLARHISGMSLSSGVGRECEDNEFHPHRGHPNLYSSRRRGMGATVISLSTPTDSGEVLFITRRGVMHKTSPESENIYNTTPRGSGNGEPRAGFPP